MAFITPTRPKNESVTRPILDLRWCFQRERERERERGERERERALK